MKAYLKPVLFLLPVIIAIAFFYGVYQDQKPAPARQSKLEATKTLGLERAVDWKGKEILLEEPDQVVVVHFWASWCGPCVHEFPELIEMTKRHSGKVLVLAISEDKEIEEVEVFVKSFPQALETPHFQILWDHDRAYMKRWSVEKLPESFIYTPDRQLAKRISGAASWINEDAESYFKQLTDKK